MVPKNKKLSYWFDESTTSCKVQLDFPAKKDKDLLEKYFITRDWLLSAEGVDLRKKSKILIFAKKNTTEKEIDNLLSHFQAEGFNTTEAS
tara:strand:- start:1393 stop:1662 length:270 start_codon:yes stop_codon:yes gene_type:complete